MTKEVKIGIIGITALTILFFGINYLKGVNMFKPANHYYVEYENVNGLAGSSPVFANGYKVGLVRSINYNYKKPGHVVVEVEVEDKMRIPAGTTGELVTEMLGTVKMNLNLNITNSTFCQPGDTLEGITNTGLMGAAEKNLVPQVEKMLPKMDSILTSLNKLLADPALTATLHHTEEITANLSSSTKKLDRFMSKELPVLTNNLNLISQNFATISNDLKGINYTAIIDNVNNTLANVDKLMTKLNSKESSIGLLLNDPSFYNNLNETAANASSLLQDLQSHPKRYVHFSIFGRKDK